MRRSRAAAQVIKRELGQSSFYCPVNEISYWAWAGGEVCHFGPGEYGRGAEFKRQLARASIAAIQAVRRVDAGARFLSAEPAIHVAPQVAVDQDAACFFHALQFEACDMLTGKLLPELAGEPALLDIVGVNFCPQNQWYLGGDRIARGTEHYRPLREILRDVFDRYRRPILISETGAEGDERVTWLRYVCDEAVAAMRSGVSLTGLLSHHRLSRLGR